MVSICFFTGCNKVDIDQIPDQPHQQSLEYTNAINAINSFGESLGENSSSTRASSLKLKLSNSQLLTYDKEHTRTSTGTFTKDSISVFSFDMELNGKKGFAIAGANKKTGYTLAFVEEGALSDTLIIEGMAMKLRSIPALAISIARCDEGRPVFEDNAFDYDGAFFRIKTKWNQTAPYWIGRPSTSCASGYYATGCGPTAMAQTIAHFKRYNKSYNFSSMTAQEKITSSSSASLQNEVGNFIADVGQNLNARYGCVEDGGTSTQFNDCYNFLRKLGYQTVLYEQRPNTSSFERIRTENIIFLARGSDINGRGGHMWIIDGYRPLVTRCDHNFVHCNWGWGGSSNGWYVEYTEEEFTNPSGSDFIFYNSTRYMSVKL